MRLKAPALTKTCIKIFKASVAWNDQQKIYRYWFGKG